MSFPEYEHDLGNGLRALAGRMENGGQLEVEFRGARFLRGDRSIVFEGFLQSLRCKRAMVKFVDVKGNTIYSW